MYFFACLNVNWHLDYENRDTRSVGGDFVVDNSKKFWRFVRILGIVCVVLLLIFSILSGYNKVNKEAEIVDAPGQQSAYVLDEKTGKQMLVASEDLFSLDEQILQQDYVHAEEFMLSVRELLEGYSSDVTSLYHSPAGVVAVINDYALFWEGDLVGTVQHLRDDLEALSLLHNWGISLRLTDGETEAVDIEVYKGQVLIMPYLHSLSCDLSAIQGYFVSQNAVVYTSEELRASYDEQLGLWVLFLQTLASNSENLAFLRIDSCFEGFGLMCITMTPFELANIEYYGVLNPSDYSAGEIQRYYTRRYALSPVFWGNDVRVYWAD